MPRKLSSNILFVAGAAITALILTLVRPSPQGLGDREVRAAPGAPHSSVKRRHNLTALKVFNKTLVRIRDRYVDPGRIDPKEMLYSALASVQFNIPEVLVNPDRDGNRVTVTVNDKKRTFALADVTSPWRLSGKLKEVFRFIEGNMNPGADLAQVEYAAVNGMLSTLDPHSSLLDPDLAAEMDVNTSGKFGGLGIIIGMRDRKLTVIRPFKDTPASRAGIQPGDHIAKINNEITENLTTQEAADRMRGDPGTSVTLWIQREGEPSLRQIPMTRAIIRVPSVDYKLLDKVGYLKLKQFAATTSKEMKKAMREMKAGGARAWIVDLRSNPGGLLEQAIQVADLFVDKGTIVTTVGGRERESRRASRSGSDTKLPIAVLVNGNSASASEIVAGALKNLERSITIGSSTFGKGSVQILYDNNDGSKLKLTIAEYLTPKDLSIQSVGIIPDIELFRRYVPDKNEGPRSYMRLLRPSVSHREADLKASLRSKYARRAMRPDFHLDYLHEAKKREDAAPAEDGEDGDAPDAEPDPDAEGINVDFTIELASEIVLQAGANSRARMVKSARRLLARRVAAETSKLTAKLANLGIDWSAASRNAARPRLDATFSLEQGNRIRAGDTVKVIGEVTNHGQTPAYRVHARVRSENYIFNDTELVFGKIEPGQSRTWTAHVKIPEASLDGLAMLHFVVTGDRGARARAKPIKVRINAAERPIFAYAHQLIDGGNGDGLVQKGESHKLQVRIKNTGKGVAKETSAILRNASGTALTMNKARFEIGELKPGEEKQVEFEFNAKIGNGESEIVVELMVNDWNLRESVSEKLKYPVRRADRGPDKARGAVEIRAAWASIYEGAAATSSQVASAKRGSVFRLTGRLGEWYRIEGADGRPGFIHTSQAKRTNKRATPKRFAVRWQVTPPKLALNVPSYETRGKSYNLSGVVTDDTRVEDVYVFVSNREAKVENRKVFYQSNRQGSSANRLTFNESIPLWPGNNMITVVARENGEVQSQKTLFIYRSDGAKLAQEMSKN
jgi:carboxyl-terminal processing protease